MNNFYVEKCIYMSEILPALIDIDKSYLLLDNYTTFIQKCVKDWADKDKKYSRLDTISSMEKYILENEKEILDLAKRLDINDKGEIK